MSVTANSGLGFSAAGDSGTLEVLIDTAKALAFDASNGKLQVTLDSSKGIGFDGSGRLALVPDDSTIGFDGSGQIEVKDDGIGSDQLAPLGVDTAALANNSVTLAKLGYQAQLDEFNVVGQTLFTLSQAVGDSVYRTSATVRAYLNGQRLRNAANMGAGMAAGSYFVFQDGSDTKVAIKSSDALASGDIFLVDYIY